MTADQFRDKQAREKARLRRKGGHLLICNSPARFRVRRGGIVANALTYGKPQGSR